MQASRRQFVKFSAASLATGMSISACTSDSGGTGLAIANASGNLNLTLAEMMRRERLFEAYGVKVNPIEVADGTRILGGIVSGSLHASLISGIGQVFPAIAKGARLRIIGGAINRPQLAVYTRRGEIASLKDLESKVIGAGSVGALTWQLTVTLLRQAGVEVSKVRFVNIGSSADVFRAVAAGTIDAGAAAASLSEAPLPDGVRMIAGSNMAEALPQFAYSGAWASLEAIEQRRDELVRALAAHGRLYRLLHTDAGKAPFIAARKAVLPRATDSEHEAQWRFLQRWKPFAADLLIDPARIDYLQDLEASFGVNHRRLSFADVADMSLAKEALALLDRG